MAFPYYVGLRNINRKGYQPMEIIVEEKAKTFKDLEQEIFKIACRSAMEVTKEILKKKDDEIFLKVDKEKYKSEGFRKTSIKTIYGAVEYRRRVYRTFLEDGKKAYVYLLDEALGMDSIGLISENLAEKIADIATEAPYRETANEISSTTGIDISAQGAWNLMQQVGERIEKEEDHAVNQMHTGNAKGKKAIPILLEEMDGVWIRQQGEHHEKMPKMEVKVSTTYEGWDKKKEVEGRSTLVGKRVLAGIEDSNSFHEKREADICKHYDVDEIEQRVLNGDGGSWISEPNDPDAIIQLDPFHVQKEIRSKIADKEAQHEIKELLETKQIDQMLRYIGIYANSVESNDKKDKRAQNAWELHKYLSNNKEHLIPWRERGIKLPEPPDGVVYKNMGVQENQNCTIITLRMKHRRMRWSASGGNNMAKALYRKENRELRDTISRYSKELIFEKEIIEAINILSAAKAPKKDGKGNPYIDLTNRHMPLIDAMLTESRKVFRGLTY